MWKKIKKKFFKEQEPTIDYVIIGLGNPGEKYRNTVHNVGFRIISTVREDNLLPSFVKDNTLSALVSEGTIDDKRIALVAPLTFMNLSGETVRRVVKKYSINTSRLVVVHDDADIVAGEARISINRGSAGHKGVSSIINSVKSKNFVRIRVGFDTNNKKALDVVLKNADILTRQTEDVIAREIPALVDSGFVSKKISCVENKKTP